MALLLENGDFLLLESGDFLLLEDGEAPATTDLKRTFIYEEHLDPIKKRGKAVLNGYILAGQAAFYRMTPISTTFDPPADEPLKPNELEYELDKLCFISQELEAHLCDCRGDTWDESLGPPPVGSDLITEVPS